LHDQIKAIAFKKAEKAGIAKKKIMRIYIIDEPYNFNDTVVEPKEVLYKSTEGHNPACLRRHSFLHVSGAYNYYPVVVFYKA
jgi:hypothetical protein